MLNGGARGRYAGSAMASSFGASSTAGGCSHRIKQPIWTAIGEGTLWLGVTGVSAMSAPIVDVRFLRGVFIGLVLATVMSFAGLVYALLAVPSPPAGMTLSFLP